MSDIIGDVSLGDEPNPEYAVPIATITAKTLNADFVRSTLQAHIKDLTNINIKPFIDTVNADVDAQLTEWDLGAFTTLTAIQKSRVKLYFAYEVGVQIAVNNKELTLALKKLQRNALNKIISLESTGGTESSVSSESEYFQEYYPQ